MGRIRRLTRKRATCAEELQSLPSMKTLRETWLVSVNKTTASGAAALPPTPPGRLHPCLDDDIGLGLLARATIIRAIMKTEIKRDYLDDKLSLPSDAPWYIGLTNKTHAAELFSQDALGTNPKQWLHKEASNATTLLDLGWRNKICWGFSEGRYRVAGLNGWFGSLYRMNLAGGAMTEHQLFATRFFGESAIDNYIRFLLQGIYVPSANHTLAHHPQFSEAELKDDPVRADIVAQIIARLKNPDNEGKPIVTISCEGNPTAASRLATTLVKRLDKDMRSACYIPLSKFTSQEQLNDHGFRSIVEVIHRFITGEAKLECSPSEWSEPDLAAKLRQVRSHLVRVPTVFVFDGFKPGASPYPALVNFIRDEPLERILRLLQHPEPGEWSAASGENLVSFRQSYFVVIGEPSSTWLSMHRNLAAELKFSELDQRNALGTAPLQRLAALMMATQAERQLAHAQNEWTLDVLSFMQRKDALSATDFADATSYQQVLSDAFARYWNSRKPWERTYLRALALSESGLRWSTSAQVFESYLRVGGRPGATNAEPAAEPVSDNIFRGFVDSACDASICSPLLFQYSDGMESDAYDVFDYPSEAISKMSDSHSWIAARNARKTRKQYTVDFRDIEVKNLILQMTTPNEALVIRRILAELSLQTYRIRIRHSRPVRRIGRRAARSLAEGLLHGFLSLDPDPETGRAHAALPDYTLGEIPAPSVDAFSFLYSVVYKDLLCGGDITGIGRQHGNGDLELELLLMIGTGQQQSTQRRALDAPLPCVQVPIWFSFGREPFDDTARSNSLTYLFALCRCAKRASRINVFRAALEKARAMHDEEPLNPPDLLTLRKLECDLGMMSYGGALHERKTGFRLWDDVLSAVVQCCFPAAPAQENEQRADHLRGQLLAMKRAVRHYVKNLIDDSGPRDGSNIATHLPISPAKIDEIVEEYSAGVQRVLPASSLPREALTVLSRIAAIESFAAERSRSKLASAADSERQGLTHEAIKGYLVAIAFYWLSKSIALRQRKDRPLSPASRVGFNATERFIACVSSIKELLERQNAELSGHHKTELMHRLCKRARGMLDTYTREQGMEKADHIAVQILECTFSRIVTPSTLQLAKFVSSDSPTGDERLSGSLRCFHWLRAAELEMLSFSGRPTLRAMLCQERLNCARDVLDRAAEQLTKDDGKTLIPRKFDEGDGEAFHPFVEWVINDVRQLGHIIDFMERYSPDALFIRHEWIESLREFLSSTQARMPRWQAKEDGPYNRSLSLLARVIEELNNRLWENAAHVAASASCAVPVSPLVRPLRAA